MRRCVSVLLLLLVAFFSFIGGFYFFFPRDAALAFFWRKGVLIASQKGVTLETAALTVEGYLPFIIVGRNVRITAPVVSVEAGEMKISPRFFESLFTMAPTAEVSFKSLSLNLPLPGQAPLFFSSYTSTAALLSSGVRLSKIRTFGELQVVGEMTMNLKTLRLDEAELSISGDRTALLEYVKSMLPLQKEASGTWTLKRKGGDSK
jgi:hypothetical protein